MEDVVARYDYSNVRTSRAKKTLQEASFAPIPFETAVKYFDDMKTIFGNIFNYKPDGCTLRAHLMSGYLLEHGINPEKAWVVSNKLQGGPQFLNPPNSDTQWLYHVAPTINVKMPNSTKPVKVVLDPALFDAPVSVCEWEHYTGAAEIGRKAKITPFLSYYTVATKMEQLTQERVREDFDVLTTKSENNFGYQRYPSQLMDEFTKSARKNTEKERRPAQKRKSKPSLSV